MDNINILVNLGTKKEAEKLSHDLSDLLCWWQGFKAGIRTVEEFDNVTGIANNGIEAAKEINIKLKTVLKY